MSSTLDPDNLTNGPDRILGKGHGTGALGPSDTSDSGSDIQGGQWPMQEADLDGGTSSDPQAIDSAAELTSFENMLDSDTDSTGTGERASAGNDEVIDGADINVDHIESLFPDADDEDWPERRDSEA